MKAYWDSSALIEATSDALLRARLRADKGVTRTHSLGETFSTLTGNPLIRMDHTSAVAAIEDLSGDLDFVDLSAAKVIAALKQAKDKGVRGAHVHDLLHAAAADKAGVHDLLTTDTNDFQGLPNKVKIVGI